MKARNVISDLAQDEDKDQILEINRLEYGEGDSLATPEDYTWRHDQNPAGKALVPVIRNSSGRVVGFIWILPLRIRIRGQDRLAAAGTNLVVHPEYRGTPGYVRLIRRFNQVFAEQEIPLHFSFVSEETYRRRKRHSPQTVATVPLLIRPLDCGSLARSYSSKTWQYLVINLVGRFTSSVVFRPQRAGFDSDVTIGAADSFTSGFDAFWRAVRDRHPVTVIRDRAFLSWRFAPVSRRSYHILVARERDQMVGYAVLRCAKVRGVELGLIADLLVSDGILGERAGGLLMREAEACFRARKVCLAAGLVMPRAVEYRIMRQAGYFPIPPTLAPRTFRFAFFQHNTHDKELARLSTQDWFVTLADYESF